MLYNFDDNFDVNNWILSQFFFLSFFHQFCKHKNQPINTNARQTFKKKKISPAKQFVHWIDRYLKDCNKIDLRLRNWWWDLMFWWPNSCVTQWNVGYPPWAKFFGSFLKKSFHSNRIEFLMCIRKNVVKLVDGLNETVFDFIFKFGFRPYNGFLP